MSPHLLSQCVTSLHNNTYDTHITIIIIIIIIITAYLWSITNILRVSRNGFLLTATPC